MPIVGRADVPKGPWSRLNDADFVRAVLNAHRRSRQETSTWRANVRTEYDFYAGEQWSQEDKNKLDREKRPHIVFNRTGPTIDAVGGMERHNRQEVAFLPRTIDETPDGVNDGEIAESFGAVVAYHRDKADVEDEESHAFHDMLLSGMGWTETWVDYEEDPDGLIRTERISPLEMYWDPTASKHNITDARWVSRIRMLRQEDVEEEWGVELPGQHQDEIDYLLDDDRSDLPETRWEGYVPVYQVQWWEKEKYTRFADPETGEILELPPDQYRDVEDAYGRLGGVTFTRKVYHQGWIGGAQLLERGPLHENEKFQTCPDFTLRCMTNKLDERRRTYFGLMRQMHDPQQFANKFLSQTMHIMNTGAKGGIMAEKSAFEEPVRAEQDWARQDRIVWVTEGALSATPKPKIMPREPTIMPTAIGDLLSFSVNSIREVTGVNVEFLGTRAAFQPASVEQSRIQQGMAVLSSAFDNLRRYRKCLGRIMVHLVQAYVPDKQMVRIVGTTDFLEYRRDPGIKYDIIMDQTPSSPNQKAMVWDQLAQIIPAMLKAGMPVPPAVLDYAPLPESVIRKIKTFYAAQEKEAEPAKQLEMQQKQADLMEALASAAKDQAIGQASIMRATTEEANLSGKLELDKLRLLLESVAQRQERGLSAMEAAIKALEAAKEDKGGNTDSG